MTWSNLIVWWTISGRVNLRRWFWTEHGSGEMACLKSDLGLSFRPRLWRTGMSAVYLFHQRMFSEHRRERRPVNLDPAGYSEQRPLRLVAFDQLPAGISAFDRWLEAQECVFRVTRTATYSSSRASRKSHGCVMPTSCWTWFLVSQFGPWSEGLIPTATDGRSEPIQINLAKEDGPSYSGSCKEWLIVPSGRIDRLKNRRSLYRRDGVHHA